MEKYSVSDLVGNLDNTEDSILHICKRKNNAKRDYLFVNESQGKHVPVSPTRVFEMVQKLYDKAYDSLSKESDILVVGFAETATALGEMFFKDAIDSPNKLDVVRYIHTTREKLDYPKLFDFQEEHSHATDQYLYSRFNTGVDFNYNCVVFVEDEITTGNTILNFINEFEKIKHVEHYYVLSIANWQSEEWKEKFKEHNVTAIALYNGVLKDKNYKLDVKPRYLKDYAFKTQLHYFEMEHYLPPRLGGISVYSARQNDNYIERVSEYIKKYIGTQDIIDVVGTEEFMMFPLQVSKYLEDDGYNVSFHATTRSPIQVSGDTIISDGVKLRSSYDKDREVYLYNLDRNYTKVVVLVEGFASDEFVDDIMKAYLSYGLRLSDIHIINLII
jgi:hypothetical protein